MRRGEPGGARHGRQLLHRRPRLRVQHGLVQLQLGGLVQLVVVELVGGLVVFVVFVLLVEGRRLQLEQLQLLLAWRGRRRRIFQLFELV